MTLPNFLVAGAAKCGTDALCNYLGQHPDVYISPSREPNFFMAEGRPEIPFRGPGDRAALRDMWVSTLDEYESLFAGVDRETAVGEGTAWYIYDENAPQRIKQHIPAAKLIVSLRNPVDRAYSAYTMLLGAGREPYPDFARALQAEAERTRRNWEPIWHYVKMGFYTHQLRRYYETFDADQIRVIVYDDFNARPAEVLAGLFRFLGVDGRFVPDTSTRYNVSLVPKHPALRAAIAADHPAKAMLRAVLPASLRRSVRRRVVEHGLRRPAPMAPEVRQQLIEVFRPDIRELQGMIGRDLSGWLQ